jgi:ribonuclease P protein component
MLASDYRIKRNSQIDIIKKDGHMVRFVNFGIVFMEQPGQEQPHFSFIVSTKISKLANQRNRIKRALVEAVRQCLENIPGKFDYVFLAKREIARKSTDEIMKEVFKAFGDKSWLKP